MIIQFSPSTADVTPSADDTSPTHHSFNWLADPSNGETGVLPAFQGGNSSKIAQFELVCPDDPTLFPNYVEEFRPKRFKGKKSAVSFGAPVPCLSTHGSEVNVSHSILRADFSLAQPDTAIEAMQDWPDAA